MRITERSDWHKFRVVRCGVFPSKVIKSREAAGSEKLTVICVARLSPEKGHDGLLEVCAELFARGFPFKLDLVGDGPERERLLARVKELGLTTSVTFHGQLTEEETLESIALADVLVLPSFMEGLPVVLMEAMSLGVPVVASRVAGVPELVEDETEGLLFRPSDWSELRLKLERLLTEPALRVQLARNARLKIEREFVIENAIAPLLSDFQALAGRVRT
jgi:glycosyltransferase involved in cell wall biosynthesis